MSDYTLQATWNTKDALATGQALKAASATELGIEFEAIRDASATKYDSGDIAGTVAAQAGILNNVLMTPLRTQEWAEDNDGMIADIRALDAQGADGLLAWDFGTTTAKLFTMGAGLEFSGDTINLKDTVAGLGLGIASSIMNLDINSLTADTIVAGDSIAFEDVGGGDDNKTTITGLVTLLNTLINIPEAQITDLGTYYSSGDTIRAAAINLGHDTDTTISREAAGHIAVEGQTVAQHGAGQVNANYSSHDVFFSTSAATGGANGDIWFRYS